MSELTEYIDWSPFFWTWGLKGKYPSILQHPKYGETARSLFADGQAALQKMMNSGWFKPRVRLGIFRAASTNESVRLYNDRDNSLLADIHFMRQQGGEGEHKLCLSDYIAPIESQREDYLGVFAVTSGDELQAHAQDLATAGNDDYNSILMKALGDRLAEALAEWAHRQFRQIMGVQEDLSLDDLLDEKYQGIRPARLPGPVRITR
ncbi:MAG: methionine synthase, partial [Calothrix sp. SM1_5_4]|nr:methionine synthase [Calothrix sp. SM1_5_4]